MAQTIVYSWEEEFLNEDTPDVVLSRFDRSPNVRTVG